MELRKAQLLGRQASPDPCTSVRDEEFEAMAILQSQSKAKEYKHNLMCQPLVQPYKEFHKRPDPIKKYSESMYKLLTFAPAPRKDAKPLDK